MKFLSSLLPALLLALASGPLAAQIHPENITIARDSWGVPHIFAPTDAEVAYGFAWATAEDDFATMQELLLGVRGLAGRVHGKDGAAMDMAFHLMQTKELVAARYESDLSPEFRKVLEAYAAGANAFAAAHPREVLHRKLFPISGRDIVEGHVLGATFMTSAERDLRRILNGRIAHFEDMPKGEGSNAFALSASRTVDGKTYLAINSHQPLEGLYSWYEAHLCSEEGWNMLGATFHGGVSIFVGTNEQLGWAQTLNFPDLSDVYKLTMHPTEKRQYQFDGKWETLQPYFAKAKVKVLGFLTIGVKQKYYLSKYGITLPGKTGGMYALRVPGNRDIRFAEQYYQMNKAQNFAQFREALDMQGLISTNIVYADREDNIYYLSNGRFPQRARGYNWQRVLPGDTSATLWPDVYYPIDSLPQVLNPASGYVYNANHSPFQSSGQQDNPDPAQVPETMGFLPDGIFTNRGFRLQQLLSEVDSFDYEEFKRIKYDLTYGKPLRTGFGMQLEAAFELDPADYPELAPSLKLMREWDRVTNKESEAAGCFVGFAYFLGKELRKIDLEPGDSIPVPTIVSALENSQAHLIKHFGSHAVPLGTLQRHIRGEVDLPLSGGPDILAAVSGRMLPDGRLQARSGDSYIELVRYTREGVQIESVNAFGASSRPGDPHYTDQMALFVQQQLKPMTLDKAEILRNAKRTYHPR